MRDLINLVESLIAEAPIGDWQIDPNFDQNEQTAMSRWGEKSWANNTKHWPDADKAGIRHPAVVERIKTAFLKTPVTFNLYFYQSPDPNYDKLLQKGVADAAWLEQNLGAEAAGRIMQTVSPDAITIVMTNNLSDDNWISIRSPWLVAHRISHTLLHGRSKVASSREVEHEFETFVHRITSLAYGVKWPVQRDIHDMRQFKYYMEIYTGVIGPLFGTMRSAREGRFTNVWEWYHETFAQWLLKGAVRINPLPDQIHKDERLTSDPKKLARAQEIVTKFPKRLDRAFNYLLEDACGKVWVM